MIAADLHGTPRTQRDQATSQVMKNAVTTTQHNITHTQLIENAALPPTVRQAIANIVGAQSEVVYHTIGHTFFTAFSQSAKKKVYVPTEFEKSCAVTCIQRNCLPKRSRPCKLVSVRGRTTCVAAPRVLSRTSAAPPSATPDSHLLGPLLLLCTSHAQNAKQKSLRSRKDRC